MSIIPLMAGCISDALYFVRFYSILEFFDDDNPYICPFSIGTSFYFANRLRKCKFFTNG